MKILRRLVLRAVICFGLLMAGFFVVGSAQNFAHQEIQRAVTFGSLVVPSLPQRMDMRIAVYSCIDHTLQPLPVDREEAVSRWRIFWGAHLVAMAPSGVVHDGLFAATFGTARFPVRLDPETQMVCGQPVLPGTEAVQLVLPERPSAEVIAGSQTDAWLMAVMHEGFPMVMIGLLVLGLRCLSRSRSQGAVEPLRLWPGEGTWPIRPWQHSDWGWLSVAVLTTVVGTLCVHLRMLGSFTQDDNFVQFLPIIIDGCQHLAQGQWPAYTPYLLMGAPVASVGTYALAYPGMWAACALSHASTGALEQTINIFVMMHLVFGTAVLYGLGCRLGLRGSLAAACATSVCGCGFLFISSRSWFYMAPVAVYLPLALWGLVECLMQPSRVRGPCMLAGAIGVEAYTGNGQMWIYVLVLLCVLAISGVRTRAGFYTILSALVAGVALACPQIWVQAVEIHNTIRVGGVGSSFDGQWAHLFVPPPFAQIRPFVLQSKILASSPYTGDYLAEFVPFLYGSASVLALFGVAAGAVSVFLLCSVSNWVEAIQWLRWGSPAVIALLLIAIMTPTTNPFGIIMLMLPVFDKMQHVIKLLPFAMLMLVLSGSLFVEHLARRSQSKALGPSVAVVALVLVVYSDALSRGAFFTYAQPVWTSAVPGLVSTLSYVPMSMTGGPGATRVPGTLGSTTSHVGLEDVAQNTQLQGVLHARILSVAPRRTFSDQMAAALVHNLPILAHIPAAVGYDPLVQAGTAQVAMLHAMYPNQNLPPDGQTLADMQMDAYINQPVWAMRHGIAEMVVFDGFTSPSSRALSRTPDLSMSSWLDTYATRVTTHGDIDVVTLHTPDPMAFFDAGASLDVPSSGAHSAAEAIRDSGRSDAKTAVQLVGSGSGVMATFAPTSVPRVLVINMLYRPLLRAYSGHVALVLTPDRWLRCQVVVPRGSTSVQLIYTAPWKSGVWMGLILSVISGAIYGWGRIRFGGRGGGSHPTSAIRIQSS